MKIHTEWKEKVRFEATDGQNVTVMDAAAPLGTGAALSPKQLCLASIAGCSGIDLAVYFRKHRQEPTSVRIDAEAPVATGYPSVFTSVQLDFRIDGPVTEEHAATAVRESQTKHCGVSAMMAKNCPIFYRIILNGETVGEGQADFSKAGA